MIMYRYETGQRDWIYSEYIEQWFRLWPGRWWGYVGVEMAEGEGHFWGRVVRMRDGEVWVQREGFKSRRLAIGWVEAAVRDAG